MAQNQAELIPKTSRGRTERVDAAPSTVPRTVIALPEWPLILSLPAGLRRSS
jgi:hypothetical protein